MAGLRKGPEVEELESAAHRGQCEQGVELMPEMCMDLAVPDAAAAAVGF
jgi:hypothetical protein